MKKYLKIFVVCFCLVALLSVSCLATSAQTTSTTSSAYGHYISPGEYVFSETLNFSMLSVSDYYLDFRFSSSGLNFDQIYISLFSSGGSVYLSFLNFGAQSQTIYDGLVSDFTWSNDSYRYITVTEGFYIYNLNVYQWWLTNLTRVSPGYESNLLDGFFSAFTIIGQWISGATSSLTSMFWANNSLTFLGTLAVAGLSFAVAFLIVGLIQCFLHFRG